MSNYSERLETPFGGKNLASNHKVSTTNATDNAFTKSQSRATSKYRRHLQNSVEEAQFRYKVESQYQRAQKDVPKLVAHDKKPAGERLFQGVVPPNRIRESLAKTGKAPGSHLRKPPIGRPSKSNDPNNIFSVPPSLGGAPKSQRGGLETRGPHGQPLSAQRASSKQQLLRNSDAAWSQDRKLFNQALSDYQKGQTSNQMPTALQKGTKVKIRLDGARQADALGGADGLPGGSSVFDHKTMGSRSSGRALNDLQKSMHSQMPSKQFSEAGSSKL